MKNKAYYIGFSQTGIGEAIKNALLEAGEYTRCDVVETIGKKDHMAQGHYQVTVTAYHE